MADQWTPVATGIVPPNPQAGLNTLSNLLGIQQQRQALQTGQYTQASAQAESQVAGQNAKEKMALAQLLQDPVGNGIVDSDGNPTKQAQSIVMRAAPTTGAGHYADIVSAAGKKIEFNNAVNNLRTNERTEVQNTLGGVAADPNATASDAATALGNLVESKRGTPVYDDYKTIGETASTVLNHADQEQKKLGKQIPPGTEAWRPLALNLVRGGLGAAGIAGAGGIAAGTPTIMQTATGQQPGVIAPALAGGGFTPTGEEVSAPPSVVTGPGNQLLRVPRGATTATEISAPPAAGPPPPPSGKLQPLQKPGLNDPAGQANYTARIKQAGDEQAAVSNAANDPQNGVQVSRYRNGQILDLTKVAPTGPGKDIWNHVASQLPQDTSIGQNADAFQKIGHYLAQNSAAMAGKMGVPNTNMGQETAAAAAGNPGQNPGAIKEITKVNDALNTGFDLYNRGLSKVTTHGSDLSRAPAYKQAFGQNVDVNALRWADAHRRNDTEEIGALSKQGPAAIAAWQKKLATLKSLATNGDLP